MNRAEVHGSGLVRGLESSGQWMHQSWAPHVVTLEMWLRNNGSYNKIGLVQILITAGSSFLPGTVFPPVDSAFVSEVEHPSSGRSFF